MRVCSKNGGKNNNLQFLLNEDVISYYWMGFILADGSFHGNSIKLHISDFDKEHLIKLASRIGCNVYVHSGKSKYGVSRICGISCYDSLLTPIIVKKFAISQKKTYNPPDFSLYEM